MNGTYNELDTDQQAQAIADYRMESDDRSSHAEVVSVLEGVEFNLISGKVVR